MKTQEGNKIIAEFMGYKYYPNDRINGHKGVLKKKGKGDLLLNHTIEGQSCWCSRWHSSWDWLMPVAKKAAHFMNVDDRGFSIQKRIHEALNTFEIESLWASVIVFIQWYNTQSK